MFFFSNFHETLCGTFPFVKNNVNDNKINVEVETSEVKRFIVIKIISIAM